MAGINLPIISKFDDTGIKQATGAFDGIKSSLGKLAGLVAAAFSVSAITNFTKESINAAIEAESVQNRLRTILLNTGAATEIQIDALNKQAEALERVGVVTKENVTMTQSQLATFDLQATTIQKLTPAILDYVTAEKGASATTDDFRSMTNGLAQALNGNFASLTRQGFVLTENQKKLLTTGTEAQRAAALTDILNSTYEGFNKTLAETPEGQFIKLQNALGDLKETVGIALVPAFASLAEAMLPVIEDIAPVLGEAIEDLVPSFEEFAGFIPTIVEALVPLIPALLDIAEAILDLAVGLLPIFIEVLNTVIPIVENLIPLFLDLFEQAISPIIPAILDLVEALAPIVEEIFPLLAELLEILIPPLLTLLEELFIPLIPVVLELIEAFMPLIEEVLPVLADILTTIVFPVLLFLADIFKVALIGAIGLFQAGLEGLGTFVSGFATTFKNVWSGISSFMKGIINGILGFIQGLVNGVISGVNAVIRAINSLRFTIPSWVPGLGGQSIGFNLPTLGKVNIPRLAEGGVVMPQPGGVLANLAEAGQPEAVIPLDRFNGLGNKDVTYNITVNAGLGTDPVSLGREIVNAIKRYERTSGPVFAGA